MLSLWYASVCVNVCLHAVFEYLKMVALQPNLFIVMTTNCVTTIMGGPRAETEGPSILTVSARSLYFHGSPLLQPVMLKY